MSYVKPNNLVIAQIISYSQFYNKPEDALALVEAIGANAVLIVLGDEKDVEPQRNFIRFFHDRGYYVILMAELMTSEDWYGRGNPNLRQKVAYPTIPPKYRTDSPYVDLHPDQAFMEIWPYDFTAVATVHEQKISYRAGAWSQGISCWDIMFGPDAVYDGTKYNFLWDRTAGDIEIPYGTGTGTYWVLEKRVDGDYVVIYNATVGNSYRVWLMDRSYFMINPANPSAREAILQYARYIIDYFCYDTDGTKIVDAFYSNSSGLPRSGIMNPEVVEQAKIGFPEFTMYGLLQRPGHAASKYTYWRNITPDTTGKATIHQWAWYITAQNKVKELYQALVDLFHGYGIAFGYSTSEMWMWGGNMANEGVGDFVDQWVSGSPLNQAAGHHYDYVYLPSYCVRYSSASILDWGNAIYEALIHSAGFQHNGAMMWWMSTVNYRPDATEIADMRTISDLLKETWTTLIPTPYQLTVGLLDRGNGDGAGPSWRMSGFPFKWVSLSWFEVGLTGIPPEIDVLQSLRTDYSGENAEGRNVIEDWVRAGGGLFCGPTTATSTFDWQNFMFFGRYSHGSVGPALITTQELVDKYTALLKMSQPLPLQLTFPVGGGVGKLSSGGGYGSADAIYVDPEWNSYIWYGIQLDYKIVVMAGKTIENVFDEVSQPIADELFLKTYYYLAGIEPTPPTLTINSSPIEGIPFVIDGYYEGFNEGILPTGWEIIEGLWTVENNSLKGTAFPSESTRIRYTGQAWGDLDVSFKVTISDEGASCAGVYFRYVDPNNYYFFRYGAHDGLYMLYKMVNGVFEGIASVSGTLEAGVPHIFRVQVTGWQAKCYVDEQLIFDHDLTGHEITSGGIGFEVWDGCSAWFDDVIVGKRLVTPYSETLQGASYTITMPSNVQIGGKKYDFLQWTDGDLNPIRTVNLMADTSLEAMYELIVLEKGFLKSRAFYDDTEVSASVEIVEAGRTETTPFSIELNPGTYTLNATYEEQTQTQTGEVLTDQITSVEFRFVAPPIPPEPPPPPPPETEPVTPIFPKLREKLYPYAPGMFDRWDERRVKSYIRNLIKNRFRRR